MRVITSCGKSGKKGNIFYSHYHPSVVNMGIKCNEINENVIMFVCIYFPMYALFAYIFFISKDVDPSFPIINGNKFLLPWFISNMLAVGVLSAELLIPMNMKNKIMKIHYYIPIFLLCEFSNIFSIKNLVEAWPDMVSRDTNTYLQFMVVFGATIFIVTMHSYFDAMFVYHKLRNTEKQLQRHIQVFGSCLRVSSKVVLFVSLIFFFFVSENVTGYIMSISCLSAVAYTANTFGSQISPMIRVENKTIQLVVDYLCSDKFLVLFSLVVFQMFCARCFYYEYMYDSETVKEKIKNDNKAFEIIFVRGIGIYVLALIHSFVLNERIFPLEHNEAEQHQTSGDRQDSNANIVNSDVNV